MKKSKMWARLLTAGLCVFMLAGCGANGTDSSTESASSGEEQTIEVETQTTEAETMVTEATVEETTTETEEEGISVSEIYEKITGEITLNSPMEMDSDFLYNYYGIDTETLDEYVFSISETAISAETVAIFKVSDESQIESITASLETVLNEKRDEMRDYLPDQFNIVDKSSVETSGQYVWLVISESADDIKKIIEDSIQ